MTTAAGVPVMAVDPAVHFADGRRPETATRVQVTGFEGPLGLLLSLIEARRMDVLTVPLGALADAYLDALATLEADRLGNVSAFVAVAGQLILIKSRAMLPRTPVAAAGLGRRGPGPRSRAPRATHPLPGAPGRRAATRGSRAHPGRALPSRTLGGARGRGRRRPADGHRASRSRPARPGARSPRDPRAAARGATRDRAADHHPHRASRDHPGGPARRPTVVLQELLGGVRDRVVIAVTFLAMLELMKRREIVVSQAAPWGPIVARFTTPEERRAAGLAADAEAAPLDEALDGFA